MKEVSRHTLLSHLLLLSGLAATLCTASANAALDRVGDFALLDDSGEFHQLSRYRHRKALVLMAYDASCADMDSKVTSYADKIGRASCRERV